VRATLKSKEGINVIKQWYGIVWICTGLNGAIEIDNLSTQPFRITSVTYEHFDGLHKKPQIEFTADTIPAKSRKNVSIAKNEQIMHLTAVHAGRTYSFDFPPKPESIIQINTKNEVQLFAPIHNKPMRTLDNQKSIKTNNIRLL
jgi:hypothetical protein